ncbi:hypothetical protein BB776_01900 [Planococcus salinarum]|uniref:Uncharacterized protein n=2 Tax=Planococcus salinarum TaxID=622695 RepID=A0ABX3D2C8_9BACL|nr:hypothetical protein BB776_01900 [Planococcus salinarum]
MGAAAGAFFEMWGTLMEETWPHLLPLLTRIKIMPLAEGFRTAKIFQCLQGAFAGGEGFSFLGLGLVLEVGLAGAVEAVSGFGRDIVCFCAKSVVDR